MPVDKQLDQLPSATQKAPRKAPKQNQPEGGKMGTRKSQLGDNGNETSQVIERVRGGTTVDLGDGYTLINP